MPPTTPQTDPAAVRPPAGPGVLRLAAPLVLSFWMRSLFSLVDTVYAATLGDAAVAAVGLAVPLEFLMIAVWVGVSTGLTSTLSRAMGARENDRVEQLLKSARGVVRALVPCFILVGSGVWLAAPRLGLDPDVADLFAVYGSVLVAGSALSSFWSIIPDSIVKAHHDTRSTMWAGIWSNVINLVLNTVFLFVFHWGVFGIALSTVIGRFGGLAYALRKAAALETARRADPRGGVEGREAHPLKSIMVLALPAAATYGLMAMESSLVNALLAGLDRATEAIAAYAIYFRVMLLSIMPVIAVSVAMLPYVARRYGENDIPGIRRGLNEAMMASVGYCFLILAPLMAFGAPWCAQWLAETPVTARFTTTALWATPAACLAGVPFFLARPVFEGIQRGRPGLAIAILRYVVLTAPCALGGAAIGGLLGGRQFLGLIAGLITAAAITSVLLLAWVRSALHTLEQEAGAVAAPAGRTVAEG